MDYPDTESEIDLLLDQPTDDPNFMLQPVMHREDLIGLQKAVRNTTVDRKVAQYIVEIVHATRRDSRLRVGCSPRGAKMLLRAAQARAVLLGRDFVMPDDVQEVAVSVIAHRIAPRNVSASAGDMAHVVDEIVGQTRVPVWSTTRRLAGPVAAW